MPVFQAGDGSSSLPRATQKLEARGRKQEEVNIDRDEGDVVPRVPWEHESVGSSPTFPTAVKQLLSGVVTEA